MRYSIIFKDSIRCKTTSSTHHTQHNLRTLLNISILNHLSLFCASSSLYSIFVIMSLIVQVEFESFAFLKIVIAFLATLSSIEKYTTQRQIADQLSKLRQDVEDAIMKFFDYVMQDRFWVTLLTHVEFEEDWQLIRQIVIEIRQKRNKLTKAKKSVLSKWNEIIATKIENWFYHHLN